MFPMALTSSLPLLFWSDCQWFPFHPWQIGPPMSHQAGDQHGVSVHAPDRHDAQLRAKKPWRAPLIIEATSASGSEKLSNHSEWTFQFGFHTQHGPLS